jgi:hypothetical protein
MSKEQYEHKDKLGTILKIDDYVVHGSGSSGGMGVYKVSGVTAKRIKITGIVRTKWGRHESYVPPEHVIQINDSIPERYLNELMLKSMQ